MHRRSRRYRGQHRAPSAAIAHIEAYYALARKLGPIVEDVRKAFFDLKRDDLEALFREYRHLYGDKAANYAEKTFPLWRSGLRKMSGQTAERLLNLVPRYLSTEQRYTMVKRLCDYHAQKSQRLHKTITVTREHPESALEALDSVISEFRDDRPLKHLPDQVMEAVTWLHDADAVAARALLAQIDNAMHRHIEASIKRNLDIISDLLTRDDINYYRESFEFPNGTLVIEMLPKSSQATSSCFVATAVYGDSHHPDVAVLRQFRDTVLTRSIFGRVLITIYYHFGPSAASIATISPKTRHITRRFLEFLVHLIKRDEKYD